MAASHVRVPAREPEKPRPGMVQRRSAPAGQKGADHVPPPVHDVLRAPGRPLEPGVRSRMEARIGHDFSRVRVHTGTHADAAARALGADAYTFGHHVGFGSGSYSPHSRSGSALLAHELVHVVQQAPLSARDGTAPLGVGPADDACEQEARRAEQGPQTAMRSSSAAAPLVRRGLWSWLGNLFGGTDYDLDELQSYLIGLEKRRGIEDDRDSDNKARAVVDKWMSGTPGFQLDGRLKIYLIKEMQSGATLDADERAILNLLENSTDADLQEIFSPSGVSVSGLNDDFHGGEWSRLKDFYAERFKGGLAALSKGDVSPEFGPGPRTTAYSWKMLSTMLDGPYVSSQIQLYLAATTPAERDQAIVDLEQERVKDGDLLIQATDAGQAAAVKTQKNNLRRIDLALQALYRDVALSQPKDDLLKGTVPIRDTSAPAPELKPLPELEPLPEPEPAPDAAPKPAEREVDVKATLAPVTKPGSKFKDSAGYEAALTLALKTRMDQLWDKLAKGKGEAVHGDEAKLHPLSEFEGIAEASTKETDRVFGNYRKGTALKADVPASGSSPARPGSLHDWWQTVQDEVAPLTDAQRTALGKERIRYFLQSFDEVRTVNRTFDAAPDWDRTGAAMIDEARSQLKVVDELTKTKPQVDRIIEIHRGWEAMARPAISAVYLQRFREPTPSGDRWLLWDMFQTLIHEYLHTLMDRTQYWPHADSFGDGSTQYNTLVEGVDSLLTEIVWSNVVARMRNPAVAEEIRHAVEGGTYPAATFDASVIPPPGHRRYASYAEAVTLANKVGIRNLYAAFFLGKVELIGVKPRP